MATTPQFDTSRELIQGLIDLTRETESKSMDDEHSDNEFFQVNMNLFVKSYMVLMCAYLESYLKSLSKCYIDRVEESLTSATYPKNLLRWSVLKDKYKHNNDGAQDLFSLGITDEDIDKNLSANPHKTAPFFVRLGIHLESIDEYMAIKEQVEMIVNKRNNIVHYNDDASDTGPRDVVANADLLIDYMKILDAQVLNNLNNFN
ncbi:HEPN domain-containing protein [Vibrio splendidus]